MIALETPKQRCQVRVCNASGCVSSRLRVLLGSCLVGGILLWCVAAQAQIVRYQGLDGRLYFTNLPLPPASGSTVVMRPALATRLTAQAPVFSLIQRLAQQYSVDPHLVRAIITVESNFDPHAVSRAGAQGLMQLMPDTAARYRVEDPFDPHANIEGGIRYLRDLLRLFPGDLCHVLAAYNAGEGAVQQYGGIPPYPEAQRRLAPVLALPQAHNLPTHAKTYHYSTATSRV